MDEDSTLYQHDQVLTLTKTYSLSDIVVDLDEVLFSRRVAHVSVNNANTDLDYFMASASEEQLLLAKCFSDFMLLLFTMEISQHWKAYSRISLSSYWTHAFPLNWHSPFSV